MWTDSLLTWFDRNKRPMPWRAAPSPYVCWLSEIMLQQTTYASALPYYSRFLSAFPDVQALAAASESRVLKLWEGLGYYARARNLLAAAKKIAADGRFPKTAAEWRALPGVGPYTAAALSSVLSGEPVPVVDGNVARVFARFRTLDGDFRKAPVRARLAEWLTPVIRKSARPGDFNQAMMELGALVCVPVSPACTACPLARGCAARKNGTQADYPVRAVRKPIPVRQVRAVVVTDPAGRVLLVQNKEGGLLKGLWELPALGPSVQQTHVFSHFRLELDAAQTLRTDGVFQNPSDVPLATATRKVLVSCGLL